MTLLDIPDLIQPLVDRVDDSLAGLSSGVTIRWGTVTQATPLRVRLDADADPLPFKPATTVADLLLGERVLCGVQNRRVTVIAVAGRVVRRPDRILESPSAGQILAGTGWTDLITANITTLGGALIIHANMVAFNGASGADRQVTYRIIVDGVVFSPVLAGVQPVPLNFAGAANPRMPSVMWGNGQPASGAHVVKLQVSASAASAVYIEASQMTITERGAVT